MSDTEPQMQTEDANGGSTASEGSPQSAPVAAGAKKAKTRRGHLPRRISAWILLVLASILIPVSVISVWAINTVTDTDKYVETMAPLATNPVIQQGLATRATDALFSTQIVQNKVTQSLPKAAKPLVAPLMAQLKT